MLNNPIFNGKKMKLKRQIKLLKKKNNYIIIMRYIIKFIFNLNFINTEANFKTFRH